MKKMLIIAICGVCLFTGCGKTETKNEIESVAKGTLKNEVSKDEKDTTTNVEIEESQNKNPTETTPIIDESEENEFSSEQNEESHTNELVGLTFKELKDKGIHFSGYSGIDNQYVFSGKSEDGMVIYEFKSSEATPIIKEREFGEDWEDLVANCKVDELDVTILDAELPKSMVGKTLGEVIGEGFEQNGYMGYNKLIITNGEVYISVTLDDSCKEIYNSLENVDTNDYYKIFKDCIIKDAKYF